MNDCEVDLTTGEVIYEVQDLYVPSLTPLQLTRRYVSSSKECGILGWGWTHNFHRSIKIDADGLTKIDPLNGDTVYPSSTCDGVQGPLISASGYNQILLTYPNHTNETYLADPEDRQHWHLRRYQDGTGNALEYHYSGRDLSIIETTDGLKVSFDYSLLGQLTKVTLSASGAGSTPLLALHYECDLNRDLVSYTDDTGYAMRYQYQDHLLVRVIDKNQHGANYSYDHSRCCVGTWHDGGELVRFLQFDRRRHASLITDSYGYRTLLRFNQSGIVTTHVDAAGCVSERILDEKNNILAAVNSDGSVAFGAKMDSSTGILSTVDSNGGVWRRVLDRQGRLVSVISPSGRVQKREYDDLGREVKVVTWNGGVIRYSYDGRGQLSGLIDPCGYEVQREVSPDGRTVKVTDSDGILFEQHFDLLDNVVTDTDACGRETRYSYLVTDVLEKEEGPGGEVEKYQYNPEMDLVAVSNPLGEVRSIEYDELGNITRLIDPDGRQVSYEYDLESNLVGILNEKRERLEVEYDEAYQQKGLKSFDGRVTHYELDPLRRRVAITDALGRCTRLSYYGGSDIRSRVCFDGSVEEYELNEDGEYIGIVSVPSDPAQRPQQTKIKYDAGGNLVSISHDGREIEYGYDLCNYVVLVRDSLGGETQYVRGARHRVERIIDQGLEYLIRYLPTGEITEIWFPNGLRQVFTYDLPGRMVNRRVLSRDGRVLTWRQFNYDNADQLTAMEDWHWGAFRYNYDVCGRLIAVLASNGAVVESYQYDATDNLVQCPLAPGGIVAHGNRIERTGDQRFEYDANGNLVARHEEHEWKYEWNRDDQLSCIFRDGTKVAEYEHDSFGRRIRKWTQQVTVDFLYDNYSLRAELFPDGTQSRYVSLPELPVPIAQSVRDERYYYAYDQIGTPVEVFDEAGQLVLAVHSQAYGGARREYRPTGSDIQLPFQFMGQYRDTESGLCCNHFRYYDPRLGRYISQDPLGIYAGMNFYAYTTNPNNYVDPWGLVTFHCMKHWGPCQKWYAKQKVNAINKKPDSRRRCTGCRSGAQKRDFEGKKCGGGNTPKGRQIDHLHEVQAGGPDRCCYNYRAVEAKFNNQLGKQTKKMLKSIKPNQLIGKVQTSGCESDKPCSEEGKKNVAIPPPGVDNKCDKKDDRQLVC